MEYDNASGRTSQQTPPFLRLPEIVRLRIFNWARLFAHPRYPRLVDLNYGEAVVNVNSQNVACRSTHSLMLTCRTFNDELSRLVYSWNHFVARPNQYGSLESLRRLRPCSISQLQRLTVHLSVSSCGLGKPCRSYWTSFREYYRDRSDKPLDNGDSGQRVSDYWSRYSTY